jgi:uncharacterized protein YbbC (DUF1343 family)
MGEAMKFPSRIWILPLLLLCWHCGQTQSEMPPATNSGQENEVTEATNPGIKVGAERFDRYLFLLEGKAVAMVVNQTSRVGNSHLVDTFLSLGLEVKKIFAPEHGFRGTADAGESISDGKDTRTGLPIISLYGNHKKPDANDLSGIDVVVFDIQDVGARFYTYISTMTYVMEACAEQGKSLLVLDRPNPNGHYVDGPVLEPAQKSFVGMHPVPVVHGMTVAEYATMVNGQGWLANGARCDLNYVLCENYDHKTPYSLPVKPSPNLPNDEAIRLYPSLCFFEGTIVSVGRGTEFPFQVFGHPDLKAVADFSFTPQPVEGAGSPKLQGETCYGMDLRTESEMTFAEGQVNLQYLLFAYQNLGEENSFFLSNGFFDLLAGTDELRRQIEAGLTEEEIRYSWKDELQAYMDIRSKYLLYPE